MITKAVRGHGSRVRGLVEYLFGAGRAEEHTDPHVVASSQVGLVGERGQSGPARAFLADELDAPRRLLAPEVGEKFVFHAAVSMAAEDGPLPEQVWAEVATSIAEHLGFTEHGVRWMAVHHGLSAGGNDHIHVVANLIGEDGRKHRFPRPPGVMLGEVRKQLEVRHGLRQVGHLNGVDHGVGLGSHTRAETTRAAHAQQATTAAGGVTGGIGVEPESVRLERAVRAAAAGSASEAGFVDELRGQRVIVRARMAGAGQRPTGRAAGGAAVVGYSVALPTAGNGHTLLWFGGGRLAKDLTLPALRARWENELDETAVTAARAAALPEWRTGAAAGTQHPDAAAHYRTRPSAEDAGVEDGLEATRTRITALGRWAATHAGDDPAVAREAAQAAAGLMAAAATRLPPAQQVDFHAAARALARLGQPERAGTRTVPGGGPSYHAAPNVAGLSVVGAVLLHAGTGAHQRAGWIAVYQTLASTAAVVAAAHRSTGAARAETTAAEAAVARVVAMTAAASPQRPVVDPRRRDTSFPISITEKLARARRAGTATAPLRPGGPVPGRGGEGPER